MGCQHSHESQFFINENSFKYTLSNDNFDIIFKTFLNNTFIYQVNKYDYAKINHKDKKYENCHFTNFKSGTSIDFLNSLFNNKQYIIQKINNKLEFTPIDVYKNVIDKKPHYINSKYFKIDNNYYERVLTKTFIIIESSINKILNPNFVFQIDKISTLFKNQIKNHPTTQKDSISKQNEIKLKISNQIVIDKLLDAMCESNNHTIFKFKLHPCVYSLKHNNFFMVGFDMIDVEYT